MTQSMLFTPICLRDVAIPNRVMVSPMCQYSSTEGFANDWHFVHLSTRAVGRAGMIMLETCAVERDGRISPWDLGIWNDDHVEGLSRIVEFMEEHGSVPAIQIGHAGRKANQKRPWDGGGSLGNDLLAWQTIAPSAIPFDDGWHVPSEMTIDDIERIVISFREAARRARDAGFKILEIHGAHGYLLNQFLCPTSNVRTDQYGGSVENRLRLTLDVIDAVKSVWPDEYPILIRISAVDWSDDGWTIDDSISFAHQLKSAGVDLIDASAGGNRAGVTIPTESGYQVPFAARIRQEVEIMTAAVGLITDPCHAEQIVRDGEADIVAIGREFLRNPYWVYQAAETLNAELDWPPQYLRAKRRR